jgi:hypothetical protein
MRTPSGSICISLFEIVGFVKENFPFYSMYIDHYTIHGEETVLYCKP